MHQVFIIMYTFTQFLTYDKVIAEASDIPDSEFYPDSGEPLSDVNYNDIFSNNVKRILSTIGVLQKALKIRDEIIEDCIILK